MGIPVTEFERQAVGSRARKGALSLRPLLALTLLLGMAEGCAKKEKAASATGGEAAAAAGWWGADSTQLALDPGAFSRSTEITNTWLPLKPGLRMTYEGTSVNDEGEVIERKMQINVTDLTKMIGGVRSIVSWDLDWSEGQVVEAELACFAQDDSGNVWLMGEYPEEYDDGNGVITANPAWFHGLEGSVAGILFPGRPEVGSPSFSQGWAPAVGYSDRGRVDSLGVRNCVPVDCYEDVLVLAESSGDEVGMEQLKYFARSVGNIRVHWRGTNDKEHHAFTLTKIEMLDAKGLAEIRASALALNKRGIAGNKMYAQTSPVKGPGAGSR